MAHKHVKKIFKIDEHAAATMAGVVAEAQKVLDRIRAEARLYRIEHGVPMSIKAIATLAANILFGSRMFPYVVHTIVAGVDMRGPDMYVIDWFGSLTRERYIATGSGSPIALGVLEDQISEDITVEDAVPLVARAINSAIKRDPGSGEGVDIAVITRTGYRELSRSDIEKALARSMKR
ncbi:MAG: proteasome subunit beta [Thermoprotei archaeon]|nr:MAG: proteasome subunit beta [Thermoprotei archaeon]